MTPSQRPFLLFLLLLGLFPSLTVVVEVAERGWNDLTWWQWALLAAFPMLAWLWLRHFSVLGCQACTGADDTACKTPK